MDVTCQSEGCFGAIWCGGCSGIVFCVVSLQRDKLSTRKQEWRKWVMCFAFGRKFDFTLPLSFWGGFAHDVNVYCVLVFVDYMMSSVKHVSVAKLSFLLLLWLLVFFFCFGLCVGEKKKLWAVKKIETDVLMYLVVIVDPLSLVLAT